MLLLLALIGCPKIPDHLKLDTDESASQDSPITDVDSAIAAILHGDGLSRSPRLPDADVVGAVPGGKPIAEWIADIHALERGSGDPAEVLGRLDEDNRGTAAVALARGYRLGVAEQRLAGVQGHDDALETEVERLLTPLHAPSVESVSPGNPFDFLLSDDPKAPLRYGERWVLTGWLDGPDIPLHAVAAALANEVDDEARATPVGQIVVARDRHASGSTADGLADLDRATKLALIHTAADREKEQSAWADLKKKVATELVNDDPVTFLLGRAVDRLTPVAGDDAGAGGALLAVEAMRWTGKCRSEPCGGVDRVDGMNAAGRLSPAVAVDAQIWRVIALKDALDTMDVGHDSVMFSRALVDLVDALLGTGAGPLDVTMVRRRKADAPTWLALGRAVGTDDTTDWNSARSALNTWLAHEAAKARLQATDPEEQEALDRIARRAVIH